MPNINDLIQHINQSLRMGGFVDPTTANGVIVPTSFVVSVALTTDIEESELLFLERYGTGSTFYFKVKDYHHGKALAADLYKLLKSQESDMSAYTGESFKPGKVLYLFIHMRSVLAQDL